MTDNNTDKLEKYHIPEEAIDIMARRVRTIYDVVVATINNPDTQTGIRNQNRANSVPAAASIITKEVSPEPVAVEATVEAAPVKAAAVETPSAANEVPHDSQVTNMLTEDPAEKALDALQISATISKIHDEIIAENAVSKLPEDSRQEMPHAA